MMAHASPLGQLIRILRPERRELALVLVYATCVGVLSLSLPITASAVVNSVAVTALLQQLLVICAALCAALLLAALLQLLQQIAVEYVQRRVFVRVAGALAEGLPRVRIAALDRQHGPELVNRFFDVLTVQKAAATLLMDGVALALQVLIGLVLLASYDAILLGFDMMLVAGLAVLALLGRGGARTAIAESIAKYEVAAWLEDLARHPSAFKFAGGPRLARERANDLAVAYLGERAAHFRILVRQIAFSLGLQIIVSVALLGLGGWLVMRGQLTLGQLVAAQIVVNLVVSTFTKMGKQLESWYDLLAAADKVGHLLDLSADEGGAAVRPASEAGMALALRDLSYQYEGATGPAIETVNIAIAAGERVAIAGPVGAGKTTLLDLVLGLRTPQRGWVEIDGLDLRDSEPVRRLEGVGYVSGLAIFQGTVAENLRMGRSELSLHDVRESLAAVGLLDTVLALPDGLETVLIAGGAPLTLGQAERLMLARAVAGHPRLLVIDETLDRVDEAVRQRVLAAAEPWTVLVATHSPDVIARCQRTIVLGKPS